MPRDKLSNLLLRRYWFKTSERIGLGVTAYSLDNAKSLVNETISEWRINYEVIKIIEDVDIRDLDQNHVLPNIGSLNFRGIWYPRRNL